MIIGARYFEEPPKRVRESALNYWEHAAFTDLFDVYRSKVSKAKYDVWRDWQHWMSETTHGMRQFYIGSHNSMQFTLVGKCTTQYGETLLYITKEHNYAIIL